MKLYEIKIHDFKGDKKPPMTKEICSFNALPLKVWFEQQQPLQQRSILHNDSDQASMVSICAKLETVVKV